MTVALGFALAAGLFLAGWLGAAAGLGALVGVAVPYAAATVFVVGLVYRVARWTAVPVPFRIPTTCAQQRSLSWIRAQPIENPPSALAAAGRVALEVLCFRSLLRNTRTEVTATRRVIYTTSLWLWLGALVMHWTMLVVVLRHLRLVMEPVPGFVTAIEHVDGFLEIGMPVVYVTSLAFVAALGFLLVRRLTAPMVHYLSLVGDSFPLFLLLGLALSGLWMRHVAPTDVAGVKAFLLGLTHLAPAVPAGITPVFFGHLMLVSALLAYFPFSKLLHMPGIFLSPTRNLANTNRAVRHVNPWDYPVAVHTYAEYEDELREKMIGAGLPVERS